MLDGGETLFSWVEVRWIWWKMNQFYASSMYIINFMREHHKISLFLTHLRYAFHMMDAAIIKDKHAMLSWIRVHDFQQALQPVQKLFSIVTAHFDMAVDDTTGCDGQKHRISRLCWDNMNHKWRNDILCTTNKFGAFPGLQSLLRPTILAIRSENVDSGFINADKPLSRFIPNH